MDASDPKPNWINVHFESTAYRLAGRTSLGKPVRLDFVGRLEHMDEDWRSAGRQYCNKMGRKPAATQEPVCEGLQLLAPMFVQERNNEDSKEYPSDADVSRSFLSDEDVRRFCESHLYGPALQRPGKWFGMPWYNCSSPGRPRETNARRQFRLVKSDS